MLSAIRFCNLSSGNGVNLHDAVLTNLLAESVEQDQHCVVKDKQNKLISWQKSNTKRLLLDSLNFLAINVVL